MVTPNPRGRDRQSSRALLPDRRVTPSRPCDGVQRSRRNAGVTAQSSAATPFQLVRSRQAIVSLMNRPTASAAAAARALISLLTSSTAILLT
jgi:hypothetical protein